MRSTQDLAELAELDDRELAGRLRRGDAGALSVFYDRYAGLVLSLLLRIVPDRGEAEDLLKEVFLNAWRRAPGYDARRGSFSTWLFTIARNRALDLVRSPARRTRAEGGRVDGGAKRAADGAPMQARSSEEDTALSEQARAVRQALADLGDKEREAIELAYYGGLSHTEIASRTGESLDTIKSRISQAAARLRAELSRLRG